MPDIETLITAGFLFTETSVEVALLSADFGDGYEVGALIGSPAGLRTWSIKIDALPDNFDYIGAGRPAVPAVSLLLENSAVVELEDAEAITIGGIVLDKKDPEISTGETRAEYLWQIFLRSKRAGNVPFWVWDVKTGKQYLACFVDNKLSYQVLCAQVYAAGVQLRERRLRGITSPS